jgi:hypothetical protein
MILSEICICSTDGRHAMGSMVLHEYGGPEKLK